MTVLVTGANGKLGSAIIKYFKCNKIKHIAYSHSMSLSDIEWGTINCIVNCAGVIPGTEVSNEEYLSGNVLFLQKLLKYSSNKQFIHFSTFSELYKADFYQQSKMLANSILLINSGLLKRLHILPLPTLDDANLIQKIVNSARKGEQPVVNELVYNYMSFDEVAQVTKDLVLDSNNNVHISKYYSKKNLYDEVVKLIDPSLIIKGKYIDRVLINDDVYCVMPSLLDTLI